MHSRTSARLLRKSCTFGIRVSLQHLSSAEQTRSQLVGRLSMDPCGSRAARGKCEVPGVQDNGGLWSEGQPETLQL